MMHAKIGLRVFDIRATAQITRECLDKLIGIERYGQPPISRICSDYRKPVIVDQPGSQRIRARRRFITNLDVIEHDVNIIGRVTRGSCRSG